MRACVSVKERQRFFEKVKQCTQMSWSHIALDFCGVSERTLHDWRRGKYTMPIETIERLTQAVGVKQPHVWKRLDNFWYTSKAGKIGGLKVLEKYGNFGTPEGRRRGGRNAIAIHRSKQTGFIVARKIGIPRRSRDLAEFVGIMLGDGGISQRQVSITLHRHDDRDYIGYVSSLCEKLFAVKPSRRHRMGDMADALIISRTELVMLLTKIGLCIGSKVRQQVGIPTWVSRSRIYKQCCLRGLFDTDGCFYIDRHVYKDKVYYNCAMNFTNRSMPILTFFKDTLVQSGFHPTQNAPFSVFLRKEEEIVRYFREVGSSNSKHYRKFEQYFRKKYGGVPKWS